MKGSELLEYPESLKSYNVVSDDKRDMLENLEDWAISSQASEKSEEGSETRSSSLHSDEKGKLPMSAAHPEKDEDIVRSALKDVEAGIKSPAITKMIILADAYRTFDRATGYKNLGSCKSEWEGRGFGLSRPSFSKEGLTVIVFIRYNTYIRTLLFSE